MVGGRARPHRVRGSALVLLIDLRLDPPPSTGAKGSSLFYIIILCTAFETRVISGSPNYFYCFTCKFSTRASFETALRSRLLQPRRLSLRARPVTAVERRVP